MECFWKCEKYNVGCVGGNDVEKVIYEREYVFGYYYFKVVVFIFDEIVNWFWNEGNKGCNISY